MELKDAIVIVLKHGGLVDLMADVTCYKYRGRYCAEYWFSEETIKILNLPDEQKALALEEEELIEFFDTPEEAANFCLKLTGNRIIEEINFHTTEGKRSTEQKLDTVDNDDYF